MHVDGKIKFSPCHQIEIFPQDLLSNVMDVISSREVSESSAPTSEPEPEDGEVDYASRAKEILDITFRRVRQRSTVQQAHLPPPADQVPWLYLSATIQRTR